MSRWQEYYKIVEKESELSDLESATHWMLTHYISYEIQDLQGKVIGTYKDQKYATKQARYKYKKLMAKLEKILLA